MEETEAVGYAVGPARRGRFGRTALATGDDRVPEDSAVVRDVDGTIASPCIGVCTLDQQTKLCLGCLRSNAEIAAWRDADSNMRLRILERVSLRRAMGYRISTRAP
jgi:uncharacterized protein